VVAGVYRRALAALIGVLLLGGALSGCGGSAPMMTATADFTDVGSLAGHATVEMAGVNIGYVSHVQVDGTFAKLTLRFPRSTRVPASVIAQVRRASILGPQLIELMIPAGSESGPLLADHGTIRTTDVRPDLEDLIKSGADLLGALSASELAKMIEEGAKGFGGEGPRLHQQIDDLDTIMVGYASRTATIAKLITDLDTFASSTGPAAQANALALSNLAKAAGILDEQRTRLTGLLSALDAVSQQGVALLSTQLPQIADQLVALRTTTQALANQQTALANVLYYLQGHNAATSLTTVNGFVQIINDFIICGLGKAGGEDPTSPLNSCSAVPAGGQK
jgi:phospholipid/cholesterol/gamma-HCH transport system substrate-binding protein